MKGAVILLILFMCMFGIGHWTASLKLDVITALNNEAAASRQNRIEEMAEAILLADKMRGK